MGAEDWPKLAGLTAPGLNAGKPEQPEKTFAQGLAEESADGPYKIETDAKSSYKQGPEIVPASHSQTVKVDPRIKGVSQHKGIVVRPSAVQSSDADEEAKAPSIDKL